MNDRILWMDVARGISILAMITFHFAFDLMYFGLAKSDLIYQPDWRLFERIIASSFLYIAGLSLFCLLYTSPSPRDRTRSRMPSSA